MRRYTTLLTFLLTLMGWLLLSTAQADELPIKLEHPSIDTHDSASIQRGAKIYASYCLLCHSLQYMENDHIAQAAGITANKMPNKDKNWWYGTVPPDLTLEARIRGVDWIYTFLHVFYKDPTRPTGSNNLLFPNVNMPNTLVGLEGEQKLVVNKELLFQEQGLFTRKEDYYTVLELDGKGSISPDEFDKMISDLVNFLVYASEPKKIIRERLGIGVLIFIVILFILCYLLKREYWKKIK